MEKESIEVSGQAETTRLQTEKREEHFCQLETKNTMVYLLRKSFREPQRKLGNFPEKAGFLRKIYVIFVLIDWNLQNRT